MFSFSVCLCLAFVFVLAVLVRALCGCYRRVSIAHIHLFGLGNSSCCGVSVIAYSLRFWRCIMDNSGACLVDYNCAVVSGCFHIAIKSVLVHVTFRVGPREKDGVWK